MKSNGTGEEDDLEALLKEFQDIDANRTKVEVKEVSAPPPRNYCTVVNLYRNDELMMFGGEYFDGDKSKCYNDVFRYNVTKNEWKQIIAPNTPPPRCLHQAVTVREKGKMYMFGGKFCTTYSFHHYRDLLEFDIETSTFKAINLKQGPSARSGHRMILYKHYLILFGGFYETSRGTNFFNDLHFFNLRTQSWFQDPDSSNSKALKFSMALGSHANSSVPCPRSTCRFFHDQNRGCFYVFGGYSIKGRGKNLDDLWQLNLTFTDEQKVIVKWERLANKGLVDACLRINMCFLVALRIRKL